jgi:hypothetical protein
MYAAKTLFDSSLSNVEWKAASVQSTTNSKIRSARLSKQQKQHYYEAKLYKQADGSYSCNINDDNNNDDSHDTRHSPPILHFAIAHGMQTMQRSLQQVEKKSSNNGNSNTLHYLEAMACPHGCVNGGGSVRSAPASTTTTTTTTTRETPTETRNRVHKTIGYLNVPNDSHVAAAAAAQDQSADLKYKLPRTGYHVVPPMQHTMGAVAGEKVENMFW